MKANEPSMTSLISSFARAYHCLYDTPLIFNDYIAKELITPEEFNAISHNMIQGASYLNQEKATQYQHHPDLLLQWITQVQLAPITLSREAYCEEVLLHELKLGARQYVILGAGLDTFSLRYPELENTLTIYEIDHPATQQFKQDRLKEANYTKPSNLHFIPMDFTKQFSYEQLDEAGVKTNKTFVSLLGVSYYLTKEETARLLTELFAELPQGSSIVMDYADELLFETKGFSNRLANMVNMAEAAGEPMKACYSLVELAKLLEDCGLQIYEHLSPVAIQERFFQNRTDELRAFECIHYIHAVKQ